MYIILTKTCKFLLCWYRNGCIFFLCVLDCASSWYLGKGRPTWWHLLFYVNLLLNMFRMLIHPSSGACYYLVRYCVGCNVLTWGVLVLSSGIGCWWCGIRVQDAACTNSQSRYITPTRLKSAQYSRHNNSPSSRKLLKTDVLTSETCWTVNWHNKASVIKLVYLKYVSLLWPILLLCVLKTFGVCCLKMAR